MKWTEERVALAIARSLFPWRRHIIVPNLSWGMGLGFEIDLGILSSANWLTEIEIKVTLNDLRRDAEKWRHHVAAQLHKAFAPKIRKRFIAMPLDLWHKKSNPSLRAAFPKIPDGVGVITVNGGVFDDVAKIEVAARPDKAARKLTDDEREQMMRLGYIRYWALREGSVIAHAGLSRAFEEHITRGVLEAPACQRQEPGESPGPRSE